MSSALDFRLSIFAILNAFLIPYLSFIEVRLELLSLSILIQALRHIHGSIEIVFLFLHTQVCRVKWSSDCVKHSDVKLLQLF